MRLITHRAQLPPSRHVADTATDHGRLYAAHPIRGGTHIQVLAYSLPHPGGMLSGARILVADDDPDLLAAIANALVRLDAKVTRATNGAELIENLADQGPYDLVITDIAMPWMTGIQAMHATRTAGLGTSVIIMTALRDEWIPARVRALGENAALLHKPFNLTALESLASNLLAQRSREPVSKNET